MPDVSDETKEEVKNMRKGASKLQKRRHEEWEDNYHLYRNKVETNRITQRQSVSLPIMKETIQTILAKTNEEPDIHYESLAGDKQKEIFLNEYWRYSKNEDNFAIKDIVDKKQAYLYGRSNMKLNIYGGMIHTETLEPQDVLIDAQADPSDIDNTAHFVGHRNIYLPLKDVLNNQNYDDDAQDELADHYRSDEGERASQQNIEAMKEKKERIQSLGYNLDMDTGLKMVELTENYYKEWDEDDREFKWVLHIEEMKSNVVLKNERMEDYLNANIQPIVSWSPDVEKTDMYPDGIGDMARQPNKIVNAWFSQMVENRTLKNLGMHMYNTNASDDFTPQTFSPQPWGWYPTPGNPDELVKRMEIPDLSGALDEMQYVQNSLQRAAATTAVTKGTSPEGAQTLGEIRTLIDTATERITSMRKYYREAREQLARKWYKLATNNPDKLDAVDVYKEGKSDRMYSETIKPADWMDEEGYRCTVTSKAESQKETAQEIKKLQFAANQFQGNKPLQEITKKRMLDLLDLSQDEMDRVMEYEEERGQPSVPAPQEGEPAQQGPEGTPEDAPEGPQPEPAQAGGGGQQANLQQLMQQANAA